MLKNFIFIIRLFFLMSVISIIFWETSNIFRSVSTMKSIATFEQLLLCLDRIIPINVIITKMRNNQYQDVYQSLQSARNINDYEFTINPDFLSVGVPYSKIIFSKHKNFLPFFNISISQLKRIDGLIFFIYVLLCIAILAIVLMIIYYKKSNLIWPIYIFLFVLGIQWLQLPMNKVPYLNPIILTNKSNNANWKEILIDNNNLLQWLEITPLNYLYKNNFQSDADLKKYNPHAKWQIITKSFLLCRYNSLIKLDNKIHFLSSCIFFLGLIIITYIIFNFIWRIVVPFLRD